MKKRHTAIFCDFDGTVSTRDVGYHLFHHFSEGRNDALLPDWKAGSLSTRDCLRIEAEMVHASPEEIFRFLDRFDLDEAFPEFIRVCRANEIPVTIVSEGMDFYIKRLLARYRLDDLPVLCNIGHLENGGLRIEFPYHTRICKGCGNCKAARMSEYRREQREECRIIFIGDGFSDACAAGEADVVFAKKDLKRYCVAESILYIEYANLQDVICRLQQKGLLNSGAEF